jgi:hypothetical protein
MVERIRHQARDDRGPDDKRTVSVADLIIYTALERLDGICKDVFASLEDELVRKLVQRVRSRKAENGDMSAWSLSRGFCLLGKQTKRKKTREGYKRTRTQGCPIGYDRKRAEKSSILSAFTSPVSLMRAKGETLRHPDREHRGMKTDPPDCVAGWCARLNDLPRIRRGAVGQASGAEPFPLCRRGGLSATPIENIGA